MNVASEPLSHWWIKVRIGAKARARVYKSLAMLLANNTLLSDALAKIHDIYSNGGRKSPPVAVMLAECRQTVAEGRSFADAIRPWVSPVESSLIASGEKSGNLRGAFTDAIDLIEGNSKIVRAVLGGAIYPLVLVGMLCVLLWIIQNKLVPPLVAIAPPDLWTGWSRLMYLISQFTTHYGAATLIVLGAAGAASLASLSRLRGNLRFYLDKVPPWSTYRMIVGSSMLLSIGTLIRNGVKLHDALLLLADNANPYLRERLDAVILGTTKGLNLGEALDAAEYDFPDREAVQYLQILANQDGFDVALMNFATEWRDDAINKVKAAMNLLFIVAIIGVGACAVMIVFAGTEIQTAIEAKAHRF